MALRALTFSVWRGSRWHPGSRSLCAQPEPAVAVSADPRLVVVRDSWPEQEAAELRAEVLRGMRVLPGFVSEAEEQSLLDELEPVLRRMRYEFDHWDNAIQGFRETERASWAGGNAAVLARVRGAAFPPDAALLPAAHVLDLAAAGHIKPHIDAVRFCGDVIAGLCLMSDAVMRLEHETHKHLAVDALLQRRSLYIMSGAARYGFTHAVLGGEDSAWGGARLPRRRRVAVICRSPPAPQDAPRPPQVHSETITHGARGKRSRSPMPGGSRGRNAGAP